MSSFEVPKVADLDGLSARDLGRTLAELDGVRRRVEALIAEAVGVAERTVAFAEDGHASVSGWVRAMCNTSKAETKSMVQCARMLHAIPEARAAAHAGTMGVAQARLLARVFANPRCAAQFSGVGGIVGRARTHLVVRRVPGRDRTLASVGRRGWCASGTRACPFGS